MDGLEGNLGMAGFAAAAAAANNPNQQQQPPVPQMRSTAEAMALNAAGIAASNKALQLSAVATKPMSAPKFKKAPDAPKRFKSAFIIFSAEKHKEIKGEFSKTGRTEKTTDIAKMVSSAWREMPPEEKEAWEKKARKDKARYEVEKAMYKGPWKIPANKRTPKDPSAPKRPMSAFLAFSNKRRAALKRENPDATNADLSKMLSKTWKAAPEELRKKYMDEEAQLRAVYKVEMAKWRKRVAEEKRQEREEREAVAMQAAEARQNEPPASLPNGAQANGAAMMAGAPGGQQQSFDFSSAGGLYNPYAMASNMAGLSALQASGGGGGQADPNQYANLMAAGGNPFGGQGFGNAAAQQQLLNSLFSQQLKGGGNAMAGNLGMYAGFTGAQGLGGMQGQAFAGMPQGFGGLGGLSGAQQQGGMDTMAMQRSMMEQQQQQQATQNGQTAGQQQPGQQQMGNMFAGPAPGQFAAPMPPQPAVGQEQQQQGTKEENDPSASPFQQGNSVQ